MFRLSQSVLVSGGGSSKAGKKYLKGNVFGMADKARTTGLVGKAGLVFDQRITGVNINDGEKVVKDVTLDPSEDAIYMIGVGVMKMEKKVGEKVKKIAKPDEDGTFLFGVACALQLVEFPERHGPNPPKGGWTQWKQLALEMKNKLNDVVLDSVTNEHIGVDLIKGLPWSRVDKENYREFMPMLYSGVELRFIVTNFDFSEVMCFIESISIQSRHALLFNHNLHIYLTFTEEHCYDYMVDGSLDWLDVCEFVNQMLQCKKFSGIRIPWKYHAHVDDMVLHIDWETEAMRYPKTSEEWDAERQVIKTALHDAPLV